MTCAEVTHRIPLYSYGEVSAELEEQIESHLADCPECRQALARHRVFLSALDERDDVAAAETMLLADCRRDLRLRLANENRPRAWAGLPWGGWQEALRGFSAFHIPFKVPVGAMALIALGWLGARYMPAKFGGVQASLSPAMFSTVQSIEPDASGKVQIAVDDVQRHMVTGSLEDPRIQALLLSAVREETNPGVRVQSIGALRNSPDSEEVRRALVDAVTHDPNAGVRLKALEGLKQYAGDPAVRKTLANVLLKDDNPGVRGQAIDLLTAHHDDSIVGVLQDVMQKEDDNYIRTRCRNLLEAMRASVGTF
jgi:anti-sigma factor RsiW